MNKEYEVLLDQTQAKFKELDERQKSLTFIVSDYHKKVSDETGTSQKAIESKILNNSLLTDFEQELITVNDERKKLLEDGSKFLGNTLHEIKKNHVAEVKRKSYQSTKKQLDQVLKAILDLITSSDDELDQTLTEFESKTINDFSTFINNDNLERVVSRCYNSSRSVARELQSESSITSKLAEISKVDLDILYEIIGKNE